MSEHLPPVRRRQAPQRSNRAGLKERGTRRDPNALDIARAAFVSLMGHREPLALDGTLFPGWPTRPVPLDEARALLLTRTCPQSIRDQVWAELICRARTGGVDWTIGAVGVALPALTGCAAKLTSRFAGDPSDVCAEVLAGFLAAIPTVDLGRPRIMLRLRWSAYRAGHAALLAALSSPLPVDLVPGVIATPVAAGNPDLVLARAVAEQVVSRADAALIGATRLEGMSVAEWAAAHAVTPWAVYKARRRAEIQLRSYLTDNDESHSCAAPRPKESLRRLSKTTCVPGVQVDTTAVSPVPEDPRCA